MGRMRRLVTLFMKESISLSLIHIFWKRIISENFLFWLQKNTKSRLTSLTKFHIWTFIHIFVPKRNKIMETSKTYNRTINLLDKYTKFIKSINTEDIGNNLTLDKLIELKSILSDINNICLLYTSWIATL